MSKTNPIIHLNLPQGIGSTYLPWFQNHVLKTVPEKKVSFLQDAWVSPQGLLMQGSKRIPYANYTLPERQAKYQKAAWLNRILRPSVWGKLDQKYALIFSYYDPGYFHWITESLPRLWALKTQWNEIEVLLPEHFPAYAFDVLKLLSIKVCKIPKGWGFKAKQLLVPHHAEGSNEYAIEYLKEMQKTLLYQCSRQYYHKGYVLGLVNTLSEAILTGNLSQKDPQENNDSSEYSDEHKEEIQKAHQYNNIGEKLYISRAKAKNRTVYQEQILIDHLTEKGFKILYLEDLSFQDQVMCFAQAKILYSLHGAGLSNMIWMPSGAQIIELYPKPKHENPWINTCYQALALGLGHDYHMIFCSNKSSEDDLNTAEIEVDLEKISVSL